MIPPFVFDFAGEVEKLRHCYLGSTTVKNLELVNAVNNCCDRSTEAGLGTRSCKFSL